MPVFQLALDITKLKTGANDAVRVLGEVGNSAENTQKHVSGVGKASESAGSSMNNLAGRAGTVNTSLKKVAATAAGLIGTLKALETSKAFMGKGFTFASEMEQAQIGIASILTATTDLVDSQGKILTGQDAYNAALGVSADIMNRVRIMGLETTATTQELVAGFQSMIAPATAVGFSMEQTQDFTLNMVKALGAMGIPLNQLSAEGRSLLDGTIIPTQDRLAVALGITGDMVKRWKEQGVLVEELSRRLGPFAMAGEDVANTWAGISSNMDDAIAVLAGYTGQGFFQSVKTAYKDVMALIVDVKTARPGADIENIANAVRDLEDYMGELVEGYAQDLIEWLKELNKPENLNQLIANIKDFATSAKGAGETVVTVAGHVKDLGSLALDGWGRMPDTVKEMGIIGAFVFGAKGMAAMGIIGGVTEIVATEIDALEGLIEGRLSFSDWKDSGSIKELRSKLDSSSTPKGQVYRGKLTGSSPDTDKEDQRKIEDQAKERATVQKSAMSDIVAADNEYTALTKQNAGEREKAIRQEHEKAIEAQRKAINARKILGEQAIASASTDADKKELQDVLNADIARYQKNIKTLESEKDKKLADIFKQQSSAAEQAARKIATARDALSSFSAEIAKLEGRGADTFALGLEKKLKEIAEAGKEAKLSLQAIAEMQERYKNAAYEDRSQKKQSALGRLDAETSSALGDSSKAQDFERAEGLSRWWKELEALGFAYDEVKPKLDAWNAAQEQQSQIKNAEAAASFYQELGQLSGDYGLSIEYQNKLLDVQGENLIRNVGISQGLVDKWKELKQLEISRDWDAGIKRVTTSFVSDATNQAKQMEDIFGTAYDTLGNLGGTMWREMFETGTFQADRFFGNLAAKMAEMATNSLVQNLFGTLLGNTGGKGSVGSGILGFLGSMFYHDGGIVGGDGRPGLISPAGWGGAPRFHSGSNLGYGLKSDELRAVLQTGERVLSRDDNALFERMLGKSRDESPFNEFFSRWNIGSTSGNRRSDGGGAQPMPIPANYGQNALNGKLESLGSAITQLAAKVEAGGRGQSGARIVNVLDPSLINEAMSAPGGEQTIMNVIKANSEGIKQLLQ